MQAAIELASRSRLAALAARTLPVAATVTAKFLDQSMRRPSLVGLLAHSLHLV